MRITIYIYNWKFSPHISVDCFQFETIINLPDVGTHLIHMLGAIISGSQVNHGVQFSLHLLLSYARGEIYCFCIGLVYVLL